MTGEVALMLLLIGCTLVLFVRETLPIEVTALSLLGVCLLLGILTPEEALKGFSNKAVVAIASLFVISRALVQTGILERMAEELSRRFVSRRWLGVSILLITVGVLSGFLSNTAIVAIFIPLVMTLCGRLGISPSQVLIPLSYVSIMGGTLTLIGTSTNLLVSSILEESGQRPIGMFELTVLGLVLLAGGLLYTLGFARRILPDRVDSEALTRKYGLAPYLTELKVREDSKLVGKTCQEVHLAERYGTTVLSIIRDRRRFIERVGIMALKPGDALIVQGAVDDLLKLRREQALALLPEVKMSDEELSAGGLLMAEAIVNPGSAMIGKSLSEVNFRERFGGFVLAIRRLGGTLREKVGLIRLRAADALLMLIPESRLQQLRVSEELAVVSELHLRLRRERRWWLVLVLLPAVVGLAAFEVMEIAVAALLAAVLLLATGVVTPQKAYRALDGSVLILIAAFVPVGQAIVNTGTASFIASGLLRVSELVRSDLAPHVLLALVYLITSLLTQIVSNNAAAIIVAPIGLSLGAALGVDPRPFVVAVCFAASAEFMTPMGYQTNLMVYGPGAYRFTDYARFGAPLNLGFWLLATLLIPRLWPF